MNIAKLDNIMSLKFVIGVVLSSAVLVGVYYVGVWSATSDSIPLEPKAAVAIGKETIDAPVKNEVNESPNTNFSGSIFDLARRGGEWKCDIDTSVTVGTGLAGARGTVYVSGEKVRGDIHALLPGFGDMTVYMLSDGKDFYTWSSLTKNGFKMLIAEAEHPQIDAAPIGSGSDANQTYTYYCVPVSASASLFSVPSDISFISQ